MIPVFCLMGPTASGKTQLAVELVQHFPLEIISVDSTMVYRSMDIGTAKPDIATLNKAPHRLINIRDPKEAYSAAQFCQDAEREITDIISQRKIPLLVGGTMLYFRALQKGLATLPSANADIRKKITREAEQVGWQVLHERLQAIDMPTALRIHPHDAQRIQRALEVFELTGKSLSAWQQENHPVGSAYAFYNLAIAPDNRQILHERIVKRFTHMLEAGLLEEVKALQARGDLTSDLPSIRSVGYRQVWEYLLGQCSYQTMQERGIIATRQLAKRQLTWLRHWPDVQWFESEAQDLFAQVTAYVNPRLN